MVAAVHYYASPDDTNDLLTYLSQNAIVELRAWFPYDESHSGVIDRDRATNYKQLAVVSTELGGPVLIRDARDPALRSNSRAGVFNRLNFGRLADPTMAIVDSNRSPILYWEPARTLDGALIPGSIGSQADALHDVSPEYERWVNRVTAWVRRHGTVVWGLQRSKVRPDLKIENPFLNTLYALPGAMRLLVDGHSGR